MVKPPIVLIHGLWMTPRSWETWAERYRAQGHEVIVPGWPGVHNRSPQEIREDSDALKNVGILEIVDYYESVIRALPEAPIIMGHSVGAVFAQMLADRNLGVAHVGVATSAPAGITTLPVSTALATSRILSNPFNYKGTTPISKGRFHYNFGNDLTRAESDRVWEREAIPSNNRVLSEAALSLVNERSGATKINYAKADRKPLLIIIGEKDHLAPPKLGRAVLAKYKAAGGPAVVDYKEFAGRTHRLVSQSGWEDIADYASEWALTHAA